MRTKPTPKDRQVSGFGKRDLNKAETRLNTLDAVYRLSQSTNFRDLKVKTIADEIGITEMTFFNYFAKKEDILKYMMGLWALDLMALQYRKPLAGEAAIRRVFEQTAKKVKKHPRLIANFIATLLSSEIAPHANDIEPADRYLLYPELAEIHFTSIPSGNEILLSHLAEMDPAPDPTATLLQLASCFYGDIVVAHTADLDIGRLYKNSLDLIFC
jgi:AcrR family transcriptional regulator